MAKREGIMNRPEHKAVRITEGFWKTQLDKIHHITVWDVLTKFENDHEAGIMKNYEWVAEGASGEHVGPPWYDGLICEVIRGVSDIIAVSPDAKLEERIDYYTEKIEAAQAVDPDGYINTYTTLMCPGKRWGENGGSLIWQHETYNIGCLAEAGIHYYKATGKTRLLACAVRAADCMCSVIGEEPRKNIVPAHSLAEEAMVKLYRLFKEEPEAAEKLFAEHQLTVQPESYLELAKFWMDHRGVHHNRASYPHYMGEYSQDHCPIELQSEAVGHAVRAALMYTGLAAVGIETGEEKYLAAASRIWENVEKTKLHISGGIGAVHNEERFGFQYDLPNNAYLETCAGVAFAFWAGEMYRAYGESRYMDAFECALYNNVLPCLSEDGTHYFYENPLISTGEERWNWHGCPCCPPMFLKLMGCLQDYIYAWRDLSEGEDDRKTQAGKASPAKYELAVNLHIGSTAEFEMGDKKVSVTQQDCQIPWNGTSRIRIQVAAPGENSRTADNIIPLKLAVRKPAWSGVMRAEYKGQIFDSCDEKGYFVIDADFSDGDEIRISMELPAMKIEAHPYVTADVGKVALMRGPLLYCLESADNPKGVNVVVGTEPLQIRQMENGVLITGTDMDGEVFTAIPYYTWANREKGSMQVWLRQLGKPGMSLDAEEDLGDHVVHKTGKTAAEDMSIWSGKLYRRYE